jgi:hypothetical protein
MTEPDEIEDVLGKLYALLSQRYQPDENGTDTLRHFYLMRDEDKSGSSGTGRVAEAFVFEDGTTVLRWLVKPYSTAMYGSPGELKKIHGHAGATRLVPANDESAFTMDERMAQSRDK